MLGPDLHDNDPSKIAWATYFWVWIMTALGSITQHIEKVRSENEKAQERRRKGGFRYMFLDFLADMITGAFVGVSVFYIMDAYHADKLVTASVIGLSANMSGKLIVTLRTWAIKRFGAL